MRLRREEINGVDIAIRGSSVGDLLDIYIVSGRYPRRYFSSRIIRTGDVLVQNGVLIEHIVEQSPRVGVHHQHFPVPAGDVVEGAQKDCEDKVSISKVGQRMVDSREYRLSRCASMMETGILGGLEGIALNGGED
jgi:hypothetical protein